MPKMTLLDMTQNILNAMDSDEVNSISDTVESMQVAEIIKETYYEVITNNVVPEHAQLIQLTGLADSTKPNYLRVPDAVTKIEWTKYDKTTDGTDVRYGDVTYEDPLDFINRTNSRDSTLSTVDTITDHSGTKLLINNDAAPTYWTSFDDEYMVFDSYDSGIDSTLQGSKSMTWGYQEPTWTASDVFTPDIDVNVFPLLLAEAKSACFINLKQVSNSKEEERARRQLTRLSNDYDRFNLHKRLNDYGRK